MNEAALRFSLKVYFIMGSINCNKAPLNVLTEAISGGITMFQYREKGKGSLQGRTKYKLAEQLQILCRSANIPFIVNDDVDLALQLDADGVHIGQEDQPIQVVRKKIGNKILGVSVHNVEEAAFAQQCGVDYFGVGPIFPTKTKETTYPVQGESIIKELRTNGFNVPIVGIGGITAENASKVIQTGADGVAIISAISQAENIKAATKEIQDQVFNCNLI